ncbi:unnamed protein product [Ostreobium quekettii]|uniref:Uncharacterized protein n=1 Tax=Ostreobium quekettii TaxID=121088 RepID=A0A8S1IKE2_9CHLO|nr:unnamed protein product [Ostreobium quekettii]|eukprot:evm.model.scf_7.16 EVM.evm.TU.scf_7.16   scf_7:135862-139352(+)
MGSLPTSYWHQKVSNLSLFPPLQFCCPSEDARGGMHSASRRKSEREEDARPVKRQKNAEAVEEGAHDAADDGRQRGAAPDYGKAAGASQQPAGPAQDQVSAALQKIGSHIGVMSKFVKASGLLRQLFEGGHLRSDHADDCFKAIVVSMADTARCEVPELRREYWKLIKAACDHCDMFSPPQRAHLEVLQLWAVLRNELYTDDSFVFNKVLRKLKELVEELPVAGVEDDAAYTSWKAMRQTETVVEASTRSGNTPTGKPDSLDPQAGGCKHGQEQRGSTVLDKGARQSCVWSPDCCMCARREALLDCVESAVKRYSVPWVRTFVDILVEMVNKSKAKFCCAQHQRIQEFWRFTKEQKMARRQGLSAQAEKEQDMTMFELARHEWSKQAISTRTKVGGSGDHRTEVWLG